MHCRAGFAENRARRRAEGYDEPRGVRTRQTDGHLPRDWFRRQLWLPACLAAGIDTPIRHARSAALARVVAGGADLQVVKERLGHRSIATTEKYLHTPPDADEAALAALDRVRSKPRAV